MRVPGLPSSLKGFAVPGRVDLSEPLNLEPIIDQNEAGLTIRA